MKQSTRDGAAWQARWWARRFYESSGDTQQVWFYLIIAEALEQGAKVPKKVKPAKRLKDALKRKIDPTKLPKDAVTFKGNGHP
jgi:hypothetical protein